MTDNDTPEPGAGRGLSWIFFAPEDGRLRSGWRLVLHGIATGILYVVFTLTLVLGGSMLGLVDLNFTSPEALASPLFLIGPMAAITLSTWGARRWLDHRSFASLGLKFDQYTWRDLGFGILMPGALFGLVFLVEWGAGWLELQGTALGARPTGSVVISMFNWLVIFVIVGYQEELLSRGYHLQTLIDGLNLPLGLFISSAIFAVLHILNPSSSVFSTLGILLAGYFLAYGWLRTGQLWLPIGLHIGWNFFQGPIFGFPVSGLGGFKLLTHHVDGPQLITGGAFGPEAGLLGYLAMAVGAALIWSYTRDRPGAFDSLGQDSDDRGSRQPHTQQKSVNASQRPDGYT